MPNPTEEIIWTFNQGDSRPPADISDVSHFPANSSLDKDIFRFDLKMEQTIFAQHVTWNGNVYVNSTDNTMAVFGLPIFYPDITIPDSTIRVEFTIIRQAQDGLNFLVCCDQSHYGKVCIKIGSEYSYEPNNTNNHNYIMDYTSVVSFLNSIPDTPQNVLSDFYIGDRPQSDFTSIRGRLFESGDFATWMYDNKPTSIATNRPLLGAFVGLFKDFRQEQQVNRVLVQNVMENISLDNGSMTVSLKSISRILPGQIFDNRDYQLSTVLNDISTGMLDLPALTNWLGQKRSEINRLKGQSGQCASGRAGDGCRNEIKRRINRIKIEVTARINQLKAEYLEDYQALAGLTNLGREFIPEDLGNIPGSMS